MKIFLLIYLFFAVLFFLRMAYVSKIHEKMCNLCIDEDIEEFMDLIDMLESSSVFLDTFKLRKWEFDQFFLMRMIISSLNRRRRDKIYLLAL